MRKPSSTDDLLAKLGDSLKSSPLASHARHAQNTLSGNLTPQSAFASSGTSGTSSAEEPAKTNARENTSLAEPLILSAQNIITAPAAVQASLAPQNFSSAGSKKSPAEAAVKSSFPREASPKTPTEGAVSQQVELDAMMERVIAMGKLINPQKAQKLEADWNQKRARRVGETSPTNPAAAVAYATSRAPARSIVGWKSATVGLYAADYQKIREVMDYVQAQTGEMVNLSRVVKIALRALPLNSTILTMNDEVRKNDRRAGKGESVHA